MDPNSANQQWSQWETTVVVSPLVGGLAFAVVRDQAARLFRRIFGSAGQMKVERTRDPLGHVVWTFTVQVEAANATDPGKRAWFEKVVSRYFHEGFGHRALVRTDVSLLAGKTEDGQAPAQWLMLPSRIESEAVLHGEPVRPKPQILGLPHRPSTAKLFVV